MKPLSERSDYGSSEKEDKEICKKCKKEISGDHPTSSLHTWCEREYYKDNPPQPPPGFGKPRKPGRKANIIGIAQRLATVYQGIDKPNTEYSARVELSFSADFEGTVAKDILVKKIEDEIISALESSVKIISRELQLHPGQVLVKPFRIDVAMNDQVSLDEEEDE